MGAGATTAAEVALLERIRAYLAAIEADTDPATGAAPDGALAFYHPEIRQEELPNRLVPGGAVRDLAALREAAARGRGVLRAQRYAVRSVLVQGTRVALETLWVGTWRARSARSRRATRCGPRSRCSSTSTVTRSAVSATTTASRPSDGHRGTESNAAIYFG